MLNLTSPKRREKLYKDESIVIKEADKGGGVVIMNKVFYERKILNMLQDPVYYRTINANQEKKTLAKIKQLVSGPSSGNMTAKEKDYLTNFDTSESQFYGLPKVHKSSEIKNAIHAQKGEYICCPNPEDLSFRPIVGGPNCSTQRLSHIYPDLLQDRFEKEFILEGLRIILLNNTFAFGKDHFIQTKGTAMGTKVAPTYGTLTLGYLEQKLHHQLATLWGEEDAESIISKWKRFLDDCFILWNDNVDRLSVFQQLLNGLGSNIRFTMESSDTKLPFLDVLVIKEDTKLSTDIYYKSTDTHHYLHFASCHPHHTKTAIPYNLARRLCAIVSDDNTRDIRLKELKSYLIKQEYPETLIDNGILKAKGYTRSELLSTKSQENKTEIIPFVQTHNPRNYNLTSIFHQLNNILKDDISTKRIYKDVYDWCLNMVISKRFKPPDGAEQLLAKVHHSPEFTTNQFSQSQGKIVTLTEGMSTHERVLPNCNEYQHFLLQENCARKIHVHFRRQKDLFKETFQQKLFFCEGFQRK
ncbi:uncharacterized protein LOC133201982 [Saccostrea echinata]|uniref:uncharacterized protein LOC133201982 n=1 Tax=Saccostrea echinata TaxID=191078 RepID=UPI002A8334C1|nr:uncharacterized protein LOC133201982 [Saccostrea echinata]